MIIKYGKSRFSLILIDMLVSTRSRPIPNCNWSEFLLWILRQRSRLQVTGESMLPLLKPGDEVLMKPCRLYQVGDLVVTPHPHQPSLKIIKRIQAILPDDTVILSGDNPAQSTDSRQFGPVARSRLLGRITCRFE
jgi:nickel-type superoxide dismutase maturation protease